MDHATRTTVGIAARRLHELADADDAVANGSRVSSLWGLGPIAPLHLGFDEMIVAQKRLVAQGWHHKVLVADYHAILSHELSFEEARARSGYYRAYLESCCELDAEYVLGSQFQTRPEYIEALLALVREAPISRVRGHIPLKARNEAGARVASLVYPIMQCLDAAYLGVDVVFGDVGQRKIYELLAELDFRSAVSDSRFRAPCLQPTAREVPMQGLFVQNATDVCGRPLNESSSRSRISIHDTRASLETKVRRMFAPPVGDAAASTAGNTLLRHFEFSVFPWRETPVSIATERGRVREIGTFAELESAYLEGDIHPTACKDALIVALDQRLERARARLAAACSAWVDQRAMGA